VFVIVGSPVDELTEEFLRVRKGVAPHQVMGFGGELDRCRLMYALRAHRITSDNVTIVGEHGPRTIPVYNDETDFDTISYAVQTALAQLQSTTGKARNLAPGLHLARLLQALSGTKSVHCISAVGKEGMSLTWPYMVDKGGVALRIEPPLGPRARRALAELVNQRAQRFQ
jgi:malate/lactate dehydrogenase